MDAGERACGRVRGTSARRSGHAGDAASWRRRRRRTRRRCRGSCPPSSSPRRSATASYLRSVVSMLRILSGPEDDVVQKRSTTTKRTRLGGGDTAARSSCPGQRRPDEGLTDLPRRRRIATEACPRSGTTTIARRSLCIHAPRRSRTTPMIESHAADRAARDTVTPGRRRTIIAEIAHALRTAHCGGRDRARRHRRPTATAATHAQALAPWSKRLVGATQSSNGTRFWRIANAEASRRRPTRRPSPPRRHLVDAQRRRHEMGYDYLARRVDPERRQRQLIRPTRTARTESHPRARSRLTRSDRTQSTT